MASTKFEVSMEIFKFQGEPDVSVTLTGKSPTELETALKTLETIATRPQRCTTATAHRRRKRTSPTSRSRQPR